MTLNEHFVRGFLYELQKCAVSEHAGRKAYITRKFQQEDAWKGMTRTPGERAGLVQWMEHGKGERYTRRSKSMVERDRYGVKGENFPKGTPEQVAAGRERMKALRESYPEDIKTVRAKEEADIARRRAEEAASAKKPSLLRRLFGRR